MTVGRSPALVVYWRGMNVLLMMLSNVLVNLTSGMLVLVLLRDLVGMSDMGMVDWLVHVELVVVVVVEVLLLEVQVVEVDLVEVMLVEDMLMMVVLVEDLLMMVMLVDNGLDLLLVGLEVLDGVTWLHDVGMLVVGLDVGGAMGMSVVSVDGDVLYWGSPATPAAATMWRSVGWWSVTSLSCDSKVISSWSFGTSQGDR